MIQNELYIDRFLVPISYIIKKCIFKNYFNLIIDKVYVYMYHMYFPNLSSYPNIMKEKISKL